MGAKLTNASNGFYQ